MHGTALLETIHAHAGRGPLAAMLRHAERFPIASAADHTRAELTPAGHVAAEAFGRQLRNVDVVRLFHSPIKRCRQTAEGIARGAEAAGRTVEWVGEIELLGVDYIADAAETARLSTEHGNHFIRLWFSGEVGPHVIRPARDIVARKVAHVAERLRESPTATNRLDLHVSHDWNILTLRELLCGVRHEDAGWLDFLDGVTFVPEANGLRAVYR